MYSCGGGGGRGELHELATRPEGSGSLSRFLLRKFKLGASIE